MKTAMATLLKSGNAAIVNIASIAAIRGVVGIFAYDASKGAVRIMGKAAAVEYAKRGVRVNTIFPGMINTPINVFRTPEDMKAAMAPVPMGDIGQPDDVAHGVLYLCSDEAKYVTGAELSIDGGWAAS